VIVSYGFDFDHSKGRTLVVHDYSGNKVACAVIPATTDRATATNFVKLGQTAVAVEGMATLDFRATSVHISYNLTHVDSRCTVPMPETTNSCGLHIHEGKSCDAPLKHFFDANIYKMDPWANINYRAMNGNSMGMVDVEFGYGYMQSNGHALVLHDLNGNPMACAIISTGTALRDTVSVVTLTPLTPTATIEGKVLLDFQGMGVKLSYDLTGVDANCSSVGPAKLSCGIHIHQGFNCSDPMGHYYNAMLYPEDPWMYASYSTLGGGMARGSLVVSYGEAYSTSMGRSLVLHNYAGEKVVCHTIPQITDNVVVQNFKPIESAPKNESMLSGFVMMAFRPTSVRMELLLENTDPRCMQKTGAKNSCGIHIHSGSCAAPGPHFYNNNTFAMDPWANVSYVSTAQGKALGVLNVEFGYGFDMAKGKIVIVHDQEGAMVACSEIALMPLLATVSSPAPMKKFPAYEGIYVPTLEAHMKFNDEAVTIMYNLTGVPCECAQIGTAPNSCGLHIHEGTSCNMASMVGGHWFGTTSDPWAFSPYTARKCSEVCAMGTNGTTASGSLTVMYGKDYVSTMNRVLVVHDYMGNKIGCAPLMAIPQINPASGSPFPVLPVALGGGGLVLLLLIFFYCRHRKTQRARVGTLNEKLAPKTTGGPSANINGQNPNRRTLSVNHM
jgi:Cu/Zn superoxide dismutase